MRDILFKAKRVDNGEWVEGFYLHDGVSGKSFIHQKDCELNESDKVGEEGCLRIFAFEIDSDTLCQYTGLTDKNGKKIWENDIIHIGDKSIPYIVEWHDTGFMGKAVNAMDRIGLKYWSFKIEVMSNIFDNPELLEVEQ